MKAPNVSGIRLPFVRQQQLPEDDIFILDAQCRFVALITNDLPPYTRGEHADLIAQACNSYAAMLAALKAVLNCPNYAEQGPTSSEFAAVLKQVEEVVAKAEGTPPRRPEHSMDDVTQPSTGELRDWKVTP